MAGLPLNHQLTSRGAVLVESTESASKYRLYALAGGPPMRPGMVQVNDEGHAIKRRSGACQQPRLRVLLG